MPRDLSLISPGSRCPACQAPIRFYDNIPLLSWLVLRAKCRHCKATISPRYFIIELLTGLLFAGLFLLYFVFNFRSAIVPFSPSCWLIYLLHIILLAAFLVVSVIDLQLWVIPISICWLVTALGFGVSALAVFIISPGAIEDLRLLPTASAATGALAAGAGIGLAVSLLLLTAGVIKRSYQPGCRKVAAEPASTELSRKSSAEPDTQTEERNFNHRREILREVLFLLPIVICSAAVFVASRNSQAVKDWWLDFSQVPAIKGFLGSLWGYFVGCSVIWITRILGTLAFGREAMGLGDVHLLGAAGAVIGPLFVVIAFFLAPFFGLAWAAYQMFFQKTRQIPYGPFLSLAVFVVIIFHDQIINRLAFLFVL